jgi:hypothetical protein
MTSSEPQSPYHDQTLGPGEIRLVYIEESTESSLHHVFPWIPLETTLSLTTKRVKIEDEPDFVAVSYVWGTAPASITISCNGGSILVSPSAYEMLEHLCMHGQWYWIDAICINQFDTDEKATQIPLMQRIYAHARSVYIWMGLSNPAIDAFMVDFERVFALSVAWTPTRPRPGQNWRGEDWPCDDDLFWVGLYRILNNDWFRRLWTFQEAVLAKRPFVLCERNFINAESLFEFVHNGSYVKVFLPHMHMDHVRYQIPGHPSWTQLAFRACMTINLLRRSRNAIGSNAIDWTSLLQATNSLGAKEPVDRVWATVGLLPDNIQDMITPMADYSEKGRREYWDTYIRVSTVLLPATQSLDLLDLPSTVGHNKVYIPTWCKDFSGRYTCSYIVNNGWNSPIAERGGGTACLFRPKDNDKRSSHSRRATICGHPLKLVSVAESDRLLETRGFVIDVISEVIEDAELFFTQDSIASHDMDKENPRQIAVLHLLRRFELLAKRLFSDADTPEQRIPREFFICLVCDHRLDMDAESLYRDARSGFKTGVDAYLSSMVDEERCKFVWGMMVSLRAVAGHSFFATKKGRLGITQLGCKIGDKVCTFYGGEPLYILRWPGSEDMDGAEHGKGNAVFCGTAFIPHLMEQHQRDEARLGDDEIFQMR